MPSRSDGIRRCRFNSFIFVISELFNLALYKSLSFYSFGLELSISVVRVLSKDGSTRVIPAAIEVDVIKYTLRVVLG